VTLVEGGPWKHGDGLATKWTLVFEELGACEILSLRRLRVKHALTWQHNSSLEGGRLGWRFRGFDLRRRDEAGEIICDEIERFLSPISSAPLLSALH
jgi:hypothetical protein